MFMVTTVLSSFRRRSISSDNVNCQSYRELPYRNIGGGGGGGAKAQLYHTCSPKFCIYITINAFINGATVHIYYVWYYLFYSNTYHGLIEIIVLFMHAFCLY